LINVITNIVVAVVIIVVVVVVRYHFQCPNFRCPCLYPFHNFSNITLSQIFLLLYGIFPPMPPHVLVDFVVFPPGHGRSVTDF